MGIFGVYRVAVSMLRVIGLAEILSRMHLNVLAHRLLLITITNPLLLDGHFIYYHPRVKHVAVDLTSKLSDVNLPPKLITHFLSQGDIFVDVGAHIGYYTLNAARHVGKDGHVYAFEPDPDNVACLRKNVKANGYQDIVIVIPKAISNKPSLVKFFLAEESAGSSMHPVKHSNIINVEATTLDLFFGERDFPAIKLIKMNIEGSEKLALEGMVELSRRNPQLKMIIEFDPMCLQRAMVSPLELFSTLQRLDFTRFFLISEKLKPIRPSKDLTYLMRTGGKILCEKN